MRRIIISFISAFFCCACSLNIDPVSSWSDSSFYRNESQLRAVLYGGYTHLQSSLGGGAVVYGAARGDEFYCYNTTRVEMDNIVNNGITPYNSYASWANFYKAIQQANLVIYNAPEMVEKNVLDSETADAITGEALCMRAFAYFWIVRIWGDAPLKLEPSIGGDYGSGMTRSPEEQIRLQIHADLHAALGLMKESSERIYFTPTAAWAIEAQLCAWENDWEGVINANKYILDNPEYELCEFYNPKYVPSMDINSDFYGYITNCDFFKVFNKGESKESIFELSYSIEDNSGSGTLFGLVGNSGESLRPNMKTMFTNAKGTDWRFYLNFYGNNPRWTKYFVNFQGLAAETRNIVLLRLADFILLQAEAYEWKLETAASTAEKEDYLKKIISLVNKIRYRSGGESLELSVDSFDVADPSIIKSMIANERLWELYGEGYRYFDLIRTGTLIEVMRPVNGQDDIRSAVWPIYYTEVLYGSGIEQNEYYK